CGNKRWQAIEQYMKNDKHIRLTNELKNNSTLVVQQQTLLSSSNSLSTVKCNAKQGVIIRFYKSVLLRRAYAGTIRVAIIDAFATDGIKLKHLLILGRDNPNVNISEGPLIHLLYHELTELYRTVLLSFVKPEYISQKLGQELIDIDYKVAEKRFPEKQIQIG
ncbi:unnamed protein product, partial [Didymodactylos carnosus]